jgi:hypothetical protein
MQTIPKSGPYGVPPRNRAQRVRLCPILPRQTVEIRQTVGRVEAGTQNKAMTWEGTDDGNVVYLWEHHAPRGFTVRAVLLPTVGPPPPPPPPRPTAWAAGWFLIAAMIPLLAGAVIALASYNLGRQTLGVPTTATVSTYR